MTIFVDTNVLVALVRQNDELHQQAASDLDKVRKLPLEVPLVVLAETFHHLKRSDERQRLRRFLEGFSISVTHIEKPTEFFAQAFDWMIRYATHFPDFADASLCILSQHTRQSRVWTYDSEFRTIWRRPDGSAVPMAVK